MIEIKIDTKELERVEKMLSTIPKGIEKATSSAINRTLQSTRASATRKVRERYDIKAKDVRGTISLKRAGTFNPNGAMISRGTPIPLMQFKVNPGKPNPSRRKPVFASVKRSGGTIKSAFVTSFDSGHTGVFERVGRSRLPLRELYGPSTPQMIGEETIIQELGEEAKEIMLTRLSHEAQRLLGRY